jgi:sulfonate transport system ATP-binding protein
MRNVNQCVFNSTGIILIIDPLQLPPVRGQLKNTGITLPKDSGKSDTGGTKEMLTRVAKLIREQNKLREDQLIDIPIAIAISKSDALKNIIGEGNSMIFQESRLFPWLTVLGNIRFGISRDISEAEKTKLVQEHVELVGLKGFEKALPRQLSGGMQQRVSIARALVNRPDVLLLDEPFGALDALTRIQMQNEILRIWETEKVTMILVTHDIDEAIYLGDKVIVMSKRPGKIKKMVDITESRPRDRNDEYFSHIRKEIFLEFFEEQQQKGKLEYYL